MQNLRAFGETILFQFLDETRGAKGSFSERTRSGLIVPTLASTQKGERWGKIVALGEKVVDLAVGDFILIEPLMWSMNGLLEKDVKVWKTHADKIMMVTNDVTATVQL